MFSLLKRAATRIRGARTTAVDEIDRDTLVVMLDPKGERALLNEVMQVALIASGAVSSTADNPYANKSETEIAGLVLAGESFSSPYHRARVRSHICHEVRFLRAVGLEVNQRLLMRYLSPTHLEALVGGILASPAQGEAQAYLDSLTRNAESSIAAFRDRLEIVLERESQGKALRR
jgi:hypothetical protein